MHQSKLDPGVGVRSWLAGTPRSPPYVELSGRSPDLRDVQTVLFVDGSRWRNGGMMTGVAGTGYRFSSLQHGGYLAFRRKDVRWPRRNPSLSRIVTLFLKT